MAELGLVKGIAVTEDGTVLPNLRLSVRDQQLNSPVRLYTIEGLKYRDSEKGYVTTDGAGRYQFRAVRGRTLVIRGEAADGTVLFEQYDIQAGVYSDLQQELAVPSAVASVAGRIGHITLTKTDVGLTNVDNTSDANKPVSTAVQAALDSKLPSASVTPYTTSLLGAPNAATARTVLLLGSAATAETTDFATANHLHTFAALTSKPTTLSGYGITDGATTAQLATKLDKSTFVAKGDLIVGTGSSTTIRLPAGVTTQVLSIDSSEPSGLIWKNLDITDVNAEVISGIVGDGTTVNTNAFRTKMASLVSSNNVVARIHKGGHFLTDSFDLHPSISLVNDARGSVQLKAVANMAATNQQGAANALIRIPALTTGAAGTESWTPIISGIAIDGSKGSQTNAIAMIRASNPNPADNPYDPDPDFTTNKDYAGPRLMNIEITNASGPGFLIEAGRGRAFAQDIRAINGNDNGFKWSANDIVMGDRCGFGGNKKHQVLFGSGAGGLIHDVNIWGSPSTRSIECLAFKSNDTKGGTMRGCVLNDTVWLHGVNSVARGWFIGGNLFQPHDENFSADGVAINVLSADARTQVALAIDGYKNGHVGANCWTRTTPTTFNTNGNNHGNDGTAFDYLVDISDSAQISLFMPITTNPQVRPWFNADSIPIKTRTLGQATYILQDAYTGTTRIGARGPQGQHVMLAWDDASAPDLNFTLQMGEKSKRGQIFGAMEYSHGPMFTDDAMDNRNWNANGALRNVNDKQIIQILFVSGTLTTGTINLPTLNNHKFVRILFTGGNVLGLSWTGGTFNAQTLPYLPAAIHGNTYVDLYYRKDSNEWYCLGVSRRSDPFVLLTDAAQITTDARKGSNYKVTLTASGHQLKVPDNLVDGQRVRFKIKNGGNFSMSYGSKFRWLGGTAVSINQGVGAVTFIEGTYDLEDDLFWASGGSYS